MEPARPYQREHYRVPLSAAYPVMFSDTETIGEGKVTNLSVFGCAIECTGAVPEKTTLRAAAPARPGRIAPDRTSEGSVGERKSGGASVRETGAGGESPPAHLCVGSHAGADAGSQTAGVFFQLILTHRAFSHHRQTQQADADPDQFAKASQQGEGNAGHVAVAEGLQQQ